MKTHRLARVAEVIREVASETILFEVRDPRVIGGNGYGKASTCASPASSAAACQRDSRAAT